MKTLIALPILALILSSVMVAFAQTGTGTGTGTERFREAQEAFDNSQYEKTLTLLDAMEKDLGKSPRIESLRALTLRDLNRPRDAYLSLLAYFKLTEGMNLANSPAHKSLVELRDALRSQLETDLSAKKENLQAARDENAVKAISEADPLSKPNTQTTTAGDPLAELEMWNKVKVSTDANDYHLFLMRFPGGSFAKLANAKMNEIGDPVWNEVAKSKDAFVYRDYVLKNPNSPFLEEARDKMKMLAASMIAWEQIGKSENPAEFLAYVTKYPNGTYIEEARKKHDYYEKSKLADSLFMESAVIDNLSEKNPTHDSGADRRIELLTRVIALQPQYPRGYRARSWMYSSIRKRYDLAIADLTKSIEVGKNIPWLKRDYMDRADNYRELKNYELAVVDYSKALTFTLDAADLRKVLQGRGLSYLLSSNYEGAIADFGEMIKLAPESHEAYTFRAEAYEKLGRKDLAKADWRRVKELTR